MLNTIENDIESLFGLLAKERETADRWEDLNKRIGSPDCDDRALKDDYKLIAQDMRDLTDAQHSLDGNLEKWLTVFKTQGIPKDVLLRLDARVLEVSASLTKERTETAPTFSETCTAILNLPRLLLLQIEKERHARLETKQREDKTKAADGRHGQPGGSRDKRERIKAIWATGKYASRDICADQECADLGMSFSTARKALRNTPEPNKPASPRTS